MTRQQKQDLINYLSEIINPRRCDLLKKVLDTRTRYLTVVLEDIYYSQNASAVVRTCECLGLQELHIIENRNDFSLNRDVVQGANKWIDINKYNTEENNTEPCLSKLKDMGYAIVAMTLRKEATALDTLDLDNKLALCFGSEELGLSDEVYAMADRQIKIPMSGFTQSLNLSVSVGIILYQLLNRLRSSKADWKLDNDDRMDLYLDWLTRSTPTGKTLVKRFLEENG